MICDCHLHLDMFNDSEIASLIDESKNVKFMITNSVDLDSCKRGLYLGGKYSIVKVACGLYPQDAHAKETGKEKDSFEDFEKFVLENKKEIVAIGEIGMDFVSGSRENSVEQEKLFRKQLELASKLNIPAIIHTRGAEKEIVKILEEYGGVKRILHCFCGSMKLVEKAVEIGCYFSIPTSIVRMENFRKMLEIVPRKKILTETDAPFLSPFKGKRNKPIYISETIKIISEIWKVSIEEVEKIIEENFERIFLVKE